jgi:hypothetical protein
MYPATANTARAANVDVSIEIVSKIREVRIVLSWQSGRVPKSEGRGSNLLNQAPALEHLGAPVKQLASLTLLVAVVSFPSCTSHFARVGPGMTVGEVTEVMHRQPSRIEQHAEGYSAWYYDQDRCILLKDDRVVGKAEEVDQASVGTPFGGLVVTRPAVCAPPFEAQTANSNVRLYLPSTVIRTQ